MTTRACVALLALIVLTMAGCAKGSDRAPQRPDSVASPSATPAIPAARDSSATPSAPATPAPGSAFTGWGTPCSGIGQCTFTVDNTYDVSATFQQQSFGNVNVCPKGQNSPAPCSQSLALAFNIPQTTNLGAIQVVTTGHHLQIEGLIGDDVGDRDHCGITSELYISSNQYVGFEQFCYGLRLAHPAG